MGRTVAVYRVVLFDLDGTLVNSIPAVVESFQDVFRTYTGEELSPEEVVDLFGPPETELIAAKVGLDNYRQALAEYYSLYEEKTQALGTYLGIRELLEELVRAGCRLGVVTGRGRPMTELTLERTGMGGFFGAVVSGHDVSRPKPEPEGIRLALKLLGAEAWRPSTSGTWVVTSGRRPGERVWLLPGRPGIRD